MLWIGYYDFGYHLENAEMTPELCDDLGHFSFDCLQDVLKGEPESRIGGIHYFSPRFLKCLKKLVCYHCYSCVCCIFIL